jgi:hypothetical protein
MNPTTIIAEATAWAGALGTLAFLSVKTFTTILPAIAEFRADISNLKTMAAVHTDQIAANTVANHITALKTVPVPAAQAPAAQPPIPKP